MLPTFTLIFATDENGLFGLSNGLPWKNSDDLKHFNRITTDSFDRPILVMGKRTFLSLPRRLEGRKMAVLSSSNEPVSGAEYQFRSVDDVLMEPEFRDKNLFVIGGVALLAEIYTKYRARINTIYYTMIHESIQVSAADVSSAVYFDEALRQQILSSATLSRKAPGATFYKISLDRHEEYQYLDLLSDCLKHGSVRKTRNARTHSMFNRTIQFNLQKGFPILTTKKVFLRGIFEELMFFLRGQTDSKLLEAKGVHIWRPNTTQEFITNCGLPYEEGDMGPMYGWNWLHFGAEYVDKSTDYTGKGYNQLAYVMDLLKRDPFSRRILMTTYDPASAKKGVLYPCHSIVVQFYVRECEGKYFVSMAMYQRSVDLACGLPFNIASNALLLHLLCATLSRDSDKKYVPDILSIVLGDIHVYESHVGNVEEQIKRMPFTFPTLGFKQSHSDLESYSFEDIELSSYVCHPPIKYDMVA